MSEIHLTQCCFGLSLHLIRYINLEKEKDYPKSIPLKIFAKDIGNCAYVSVSKLEN